MVSHTSEIKISKLCNKIKSELGDLKSHMYEITSDDYEIQQSSSPLCDSLYSMECEYTEDYFKLCSRWNTSFTCCFTGNRTEKTHPRKDFMQETALV